MVVLFHIRAARGAGVREQRYDRFGGELDDGRGQKPEADCQKNGVAQRFRGAVRFSGAVYRLRRRGHRRNDEADERQQNRREQHGQRHKKRDGVSGDLRRLPAAAGADRLRDADCRPHGETDDHNREHMHDLRADGNGRGADRPMRNRSAMP